MWFKKKSVLQAEGHYNSNTAYDGSDWRTAKKFGNWIVPLTLPSVSDANNYFYLPALGYYDTRDSGNLYNVRFYGTFWSSSASPQYSDRAYYLWFGAGNVYVREDYERHFGFRAQKFSDFGDN